MFTSPPKEIKEIILNGLEALKQTALHTFASDSDELIQAINKASAVMVSIEEEKPA